MSTPACLYCCEPTAPQCPAYLSDIGWFNCHRAEGHDGPHVACHPGYDRHQIRSWQPDMNDVARDAVARVVALNAAIANAREHLDRYARRPHSKHCDGDTPCPRDIAEEALALLRI